MTEGQKVTPYPQHILALLTFDGFSQAYVRELHTSDTNEQAYEKVEAVYVKYYGRRKYAAFSSFKTLFSRRYSVK